MSDLPNIRLSEAQASALRALSKHDLLRQRGGWAASVKAMAYRDATIKALARRGWVELDRWEHAATITERGQAALSRVVS